MMFKSKYPRELLNEIKWRFDLGKSRIYYIHRGAPENFKVVGGNAIKGIEKGFLVLEGDVQDVHIPYHRIFRIDYNDHIIFERTKRNIYL
jgi:uncharacterized protein (UPF0248 family)